VRSSKEVFLLHLYTRRFDDRQRRKIVRLTRHADLAFRTLIFLAASGGRVGTIAEIAAAFGASEHHLRKVVGELTHLTLVKATRGRGGGLQLAVNPEDVTIGALMRKFEPDFNATDCLGAARHGCVIFGACGLQRIFNESVDAWFVVLDSYTLADAVSQSTNLAERLGIELAPPPAA
jgi:Rrf2 family nitric oxide-sensitive transcriptional repressor